MPIGLPGELGPDLPQQGARLAIEQFFGLVVERQRSCGDQVERSINEVEQGFCAGLEAGKGSCQPIPADGLEPGFALGAVLDPR